MLSKRKQQGFTVVELLAFVLGVGTLSSIGLVIYVIAHFLHKVW